MTAMIVAQFISFMAVYVTAMKATAAKIGRGGKGV
jgi:hypothetical protein